MALKFFLFVSLLLVIGSTAPFSAEAQILTINGTVPCTNITTNGTDTVNGTATAPFPNALVLLRCGGVTVASTVSNSLGGFRFIIAPFTQIVTSFLGNCTTMVPTPLSRCNSTLPTTGILTGTIKTLGSTVSGIAMTVSQFLFSL